MIIWGWQKCSMAGHKCKCLKSYLTSTLCLFNKIVVASLPGHRYLSRFIESGVNSLPWNTLQSQSESCWSYLKQSVPVHTSLLTLGWRCMQHLQPSRTIGETLLQVSLWYIYLSTLWKPANREWVSSLVSAWFLCVMWPAHVSFSAIWG